MSEHTPGPWRYTVDKDGKNGVVSADGYWITETIQADSGHSAEANGRLVASSPAMRAVCEGVLAALSYPRGSEAQVRCLEEVGENAIHILDTHKTAGTGET